jgi:hypothetical protein
MRDKAKVKRITLREACWAVGITITALCRELGIARFTAYEAWQEPQKFPRAWPRIAERLGLQ